MSGKITSLNANGNKLSLTNSDLLTRDKTVVYLDTVEQATNYVGNDGDVIHISDVDRGGVFIYDSTATDDGGVVFGKCKRQYEGAVNVKWFGAESLVINIKSLSLGSGLKLRTEGYYSEDDGGASEYTVMTAAEYGLTPDEYADITLINGNVAVLNLKDGGTATLRQIGVNIYPDKADPNFYDIDAGVIFNAVISNPRIITLESNEYGAVNFETQVIDTKGLFIKGPSSFRIDTSLERSLDFIFRSTTVITEPLGGCYTVASGVRTGGIESIIISEGSGGSLDKMVSIGNALYSDDATNINSSYYIKDVFTRGGNYGFYGYQFFNCKFSTATPRSYRKVGWFIREGGTSCIWEQCKPYSNVIGTRGFEWDETQTTVGHVYSTMIQCLPQRCDLEAFVFRSNSMSLINCGVEYAGYNADSIVKFIGTGTYDIKGFYALITGTQIPNSIYSVEPTVSGRAGATLTIRGTSVGLQNATTGNIEYFRYGKEYVKNSSFQQDLSYWDTYSHWEWSTDKRAYHPPIDAYKALRQTINTPANNTVTFEVEIVSGKLVYNDGTNSRSITSSGTYTYESDYSIDKLTFSRASSGGTGEFYLSNVNVKTGIIPDSYLSTTVMDLEDKVKCDPTTAVDQESWKSGYYYDTFVPYKDSLNSVETYLRNNHSISNIPLETNTKYNIAGNFITDSGAMFLEFEIRFGSKAITSVDRVNIIDEANADDTDNGIILHCDSGTNVKYSTGDLHLKSYHKATIIAFAAVSSSVLRIDFEDGDGNIENHTGKWVIRKEKIL